jgi:arylsulfatase A-like enzyme
MRNLGFLSLLLLFSSCQDRKPGRSAIADPARGPNIIMLVTDDQRWDAVGFMGNDIVQTPHLDSLAARGTVFENAFVTTSICAISRASILSGQYALRHGIHDFGTNFSDTAFASTYPAQLRQAGYFTGFVGKYGVGWLPEEKARERFDRWLAFNGQGKYELTDEEDRYVHLTQRMSEQAIDFLDEVPEGQPFNLSISFKAPHVQDTDPRQFIYDEAYRELYAGVDVPRPTTAYPTYFQRLLPFLRDSEARHRWMRRFATEGMRQEMTRGYYRLVTGVDDAIGRITRVLEEKGMADNTIIILIGDNGFYLGEHGLAGKWYGHNESVRVPLLYYDPRLPRELQGRRVEQIALNVDVAPTLLDAANLNAPPEMQGRSLLPLILNQDPTAWRQDFYYEHPFDVRSLAQSRSVLWPIPRSEGVISLSDKFLSYYDEPAPKEEVYDLRADPLEVDNLARNPTYRAYRDSLRRRMEELKAAAN